MNALSSIKLVNRSPEINSDGQPRHHKPLGQVLVESGKISADTKLRALEAQATRDIKFGEVLVADGVLTVDDISRAIANQYQTEVADFDAVPLNLSLLEVYGAENAISQGHLPWQRRNGVTMIATARPDQFETQRAKFETLFGPVQMVVTSDFDLQRAIQTKPPQALVLKAETRVPAVESCRTWSPNFGTIVKVFCVVVIALTVLWPRMMFYTVLSWTLLTLALQTALNAAAWIQQIRAPRSTSIQPIPPPLQRLPTVSILVALYKEKEIADRLIDRLGQLRYPKELLDVCLIVEADDHLTQDALNKINLPKYMRCITVPASHLKTKPRALNYALEFCRGSIVGVYDAEDAPAADQILKVAQRFHAAAPDVACLQGVLDYYNPHQNWLSRCFTVEYATWFRLILPGYLRLGLVIPLGGTTLFFRRRALEAVGGWDAHNVTEDADLGIRLARHGYRTELINTVTQEEANCRFWPWVKQRSRWLKGYAVTWAVHTRSPRKLWRDLGAWRFAGVQLLLLGTLTQFAIAPVLWSFWLLALGLGHVVTSDLSNAMIWTIAGLFMLSETLNIAIRLKAVARTNHVGLKRWVPSLYFYFPLATLASYKALLELFTRPFYWDKTEHGTNSDVTLPDQSRPHQV